MQGRATLQVGAAVVAACSSSHQEAPQAHSAAASDPSAAAFALDTLAISAKPARAVAGRRCKSERSVVPLASADRYSDWQFDRQQFAQLNRDFGPFTCDAACDNSGANAQVAHNYYCPDRSFLDSSVAGEAVWLCPPWAKATDFIVHYLACKAKDPAHTSAVLVLPKWTKAAWWPLVQHMKVVQQFAAGSQIFQQPAATMDSSPSPKAAPWPIVVLYDAPDTSQQQQQQQQEQQQQQQQQGLDLAYVTSAAAAAADAAPLLVLTGCAHGKPVRMLIDCGATLNFASANWVKRDRVPTQPSALIRVRLADGTETTASQACSNLHYQIDGFHSAGDFLVTKLQPDVDLICGKPWLEQHNPAIDWRANTISIGSHVLQPTPSTPQPRIMLVSARRVEKTLRARSFDHCFYATLSTASDAPAVTTDQDPHFDQQLHQLLDKYAPVFQEPSELPPPRAHDHRIELQPGATPPAQRTYRMSPLELQEVQRQLEDYLAKGWIRPSTSPFGAPILFVRKKDGSLRMCCDHRGLNSLTIKNRYPLPRIDELLDQLHGARIFSALDLWSGYHQVRIHPDDIHKTAFRTRYGHYEFTVLPFGLTNAPATFMQLMNDVLRPFLDKFVVVYLDDILIYSKSPEEHLQHLDQVFAVLQAHKLQVKLKKCAFGKSSIDFLGYLVTAEGIKPHQNKVAAVVNWPPPTNPHEVQSFLGFVGFTRRFIQDYSAISAPLTDLTSKTAQFDTLPAPALAAFHQLKQAVTSAPTLVLPVIGHDATFTLYTNASGTAVSAVLAQDQGMGLQPIAFESRKLNVHERNYGIPDLELLAIVHALRVYRCYLEGCKHFTVLTDHDTLKRFMQQKDLTGRKARWQELISPFAPNMSIEWRKGKLNWADALTRLPEPSPAIVATTTTATVTTLSPDPVFLQRVQAAYADDPLYAKPPKFVTQQGQYYYVGSRLCIPKSRALRLQILTESHDAPLAGHLGHNKTLSSVAERFWWPHMSRTVRAYVGSCVVCQRTKPTSQLPPGLLQPLPIPSAPWTNITMDLITDLPPADGFDSIAVFVDTFTKMAHFAPTTKTVTAQRLASLFLDTVVKHHGLPTSIVSDRDPRIMSEFWHSLFARFGVKLHPSTAYHPQTDGQTERTNRTLEQILRAYVHPNQDDWPSLISASC